MTTKETPEQVLTSLLMDLGMEAENATRMASEAPGPVKEAAHSLEKKDLWDLLTVKTRINRVVLRLTNNKEFHNYTLRLADEIEEPEPRIILAGFATYFISLLHLAYQDDPDLVEEIMPEIFRLSGMKVETWLKSR